MEMKYVMIDGKGPISFIVPKHSDMIPHGVITSSGFFRIKTYPDRKPSIETYGYSHSLKTLALPYAPSPEDARVLEVYFGLKG